MSVWVMCGRVHRAHRLTGYGWVLECDGRKLRYGAVTGTLDDDFVASLRNVVCKSCAAEMRARELGASAFARGESSAPAVNAEVMVMVERLPVGGGAARIFAAFVDGWHTANLAAVAS